jgi:hypothetical protein
MVTPKQGIRKCLVAAQEMTNAPHADSQRANDMPGHHADTESAAQNIQIMLSAK